MHTQSEMMKVGMCSCELVQVHCHLPRNFEPWNNFGNEVYGDVIWLVCVTGRGTSIVLAMQQQKL